MGIAIKLLDGKEYTFERESYLVQDEDAETRNHLYALSCLLDGSEHQELEVKARTLDKNVARLKSMQFAAAENLERTDLPADERQMWRQNHSDINSQLEAAIEEVGKLELETILLTKNSRKWTVEVARWAIARQTRKSIVEADLLLNPKLASDVVLAILGIDVNDPKIKEAQDEGPLSESLNEKGGGVAL